MDKFIVVNTQGTGFNRFFDSEQEAANFADEKMSVGNISSLYICKVTKTVTRGPPTVVMTDGFTPAIAPPVRGAAAPRW